jgi:hypothetical protein
MNILVDDNWKKIVEQGTSRWDRDIFSSMIEIYDKREIFRVGVSWHIPTESLVKTVINYSPIVSVGSGFSYTESLAEKRGADIIATDINPTKKNGWCRNGIFHMQVEKLDAKSAVEKYSNRNVFMAWPPYSTPMAFEVAKAMEKDRILIFVGESHGGCTGDDNFFEYLYDHFEEIEEDVAIPSWNGLHDNVYIYRKIK